MKDQTRDPFNDPGYFYSIYTAPEDSLDYAYPESAYGVMSAGDYGHWITAIVHHIPVANPYQFGASESAAFMITPNEEDSMVHMDSTGSRHIIVDLDMVTGQFAGFAVWQGQNPDLYGEILYKADQNGIVEPMRVFYPEYYQSMCVRLYNFGGEGVVPQDSTLVVSHENHIDRKGQAYKLINLSKWFATYSEAEQYCRDTPGCRIAGINPFVSLVPLLPLEHFGLVYEPGTTIAGENESRIGHFEIFE